MANQETTGRVQRTMVATSRKNKRETVVLRDELPALAEGEIRMTIDKVGLSANNMFYALMGDAPFLKFFAVYPAPQPALVNVPAWGVSTVVASKHPDFQVGEQYRGFLHMADVVQMKAKRSVDGFTAFGDGREKLNKAYNQFVRIKNTESSPFYGAGDKSDLAMVAAPGALSAFLLCELLRMNAFYGADSVVLTSASSKLSLATAFFLKAERARGTLRRIVGYSSAKNIDFVGSTGLFDDVLKYEDSLPATEDLRPVLIDVAGDAAIYRRLEGRLAKAFAVGGTHSKAKSSTFSAFGPGGILKLVASMAAPEALRAWLDKKLEPRLEMFFAPTVLTQLVKRWGRETMGEKADAALKAFVDAAVDQGWIQLVRATDVEAIQSQYRRIVEGTVPPSEAIVLSLTEGARASKQAAATALRA